MDLQKIQAGFKTRIDSKKNDATKPNKDISTSSSGYNILMQQNRRTKNTKGEDELLSSSVASFDDYVTVITSVLDDLGRGNLGERLRDIIVETFHLIDEKKSGYVSWSKFGSFLLGSQQGMDTNLKNGDGSNKYSRINILDPEEVINDDIESSSTLPKHPDDAILKLVRNVKGFEAQSTVYNDSAERIATCTEVHKCITIVDIGKINGRNQVKCQNVKVTDTVTAM